MVEASIRMLPRTLNRLSKGAEVIMSVQYFEGIGRRKESTARVRLMSGTGKFHCQ